MSIKSKLPDVGTTIFTTMSQMAADHGAINLSQGYPDFEVPLPLVEALNRYAREGQNQYPPMHGIAYLRQQIAAKTASCYGPVLDADEEVTVVSGATEGLFVAIQALVHRDDEVIVFDPAYDAYDPAIRLAGGRAVHIPLAAPTFQIDWQRVRDAINPRTRGLLINSPHNPTGAVLSPSDLEMLANLVEAFALWVISDEVYEHMVFDGRRHLSLVSDERLRARTMIISSFGKTFHATGWKVGYCLASPALTAEFRKVHQFVTFTTHTPSQWAIADFLEHHPAHYQTLPDFYESKRNLLADALQRLGFTLTRSAGTYFQTASYDALSNDDDMTFVTRLTQAAGVAAIPTSVFYETPPAKHLVRFCFAKEDQTLLAAEERMAQYFR